MNLTIHNVVPRIDSATQCYTAATLQYDGPHLSAALSPTPQLHQLLRETPTGALYVVRPDGRTEVFHAGPLAFPNGLAIDPDERYLHVALSSGSSIVRLPLVQRRDSCAVESVIKLENGLVPDGLAFTDDSRFVIACYVPDRILIAGRTGRVEVLMDDPGGELLNRPTNVALANGRVYFANLGGWHIGGFLFEGKPMRLRFPTP